MNPNNPEDTPTTPPEESWVIQPAGWRDLNKLGHLERLCFRSEDVWPLWDLIGVLSFPGFVRLKVEVDGRMVGFISGEQQPQKGQGWITSLAVHPDYRRRGIARALLMACEEELPQPVIRLSVRASNQGAISLYERAGYRVVDQWLRYYAGGESALVLEKSV